MKQFCIVLAAFTCTFAAAAQANTCQQLPPIAWNNTARVDFSFLGIVNASIKHVAPVKALYAHSLCGLEPSRFERLVREGGGEVFELAPSLVKSLDAMTPYFPRVDFVYVRSGGPQKPLVVILFANGYQGDLFVVDKAQNWTRSAVERIGQIWNALPFLYVSQASTWLHDAALYQSTYTARIDANILGVAPFSVPIPAYKSNAGRGLANPLGSMLVPKDNVNNGADFWIHELAHYNNYALSGWLALFYADAFAQISRHNATVNELIEGQARTLTGPIDSFPVGFLKDLARLAGTTVLPLVFVENDVSLQQRYRDACRDGHWTKTGLPRGYVSGYAFCGETVLEDFGDTLSTAVGLTSTVSRKLAQMQRPRHVPSTLDRALEDYLPGRQYSAAHLFDRGDEASLALKKKANFIASRFSFSLSAAMDADGDGFPWKSGQGKGGANVDCDDTNPLIGTCDADSCEDLSECDDGKSCTSDSCEMGHCRNQAVDADGDGSLSPECGGADCDDTTAARSPTAPERCGDFIDNDCDGLFDDSLSVDAAAWYQDLDGDGFGAGPAVRACVKPRSRYVSTPGDCDDSQFSRNPNAVEDCQSTVDLNCDGRAGGEDADGDGVKGCAGDCNDADASILPGQLERCDNVDNNCDGSIDENPQGAGASCSTLLPGVCNAGQLRCQSGTLRCAMLTQPRAETCNGFDDDCNGRTDEGVLRVYYADADGDGYGNPLKAVEACSQPPQTVTNSGDCGDTAAAAHPGQTLFFTTPFWTNRTNVSSYDYNCDGTTEPSDSNVFSCAPGVVSADVRPGWEGVVAGCGETKNHVGPGSSVVWSWFGCWPSWGQLTQMCR